LTRLLLERLMRSGSARVVNVASGSHYQARGIDFDALRQPTASVTGLPEYGVSKLCNVLFTRELARRFPQLNTYSLHPGVVASNAWRRVPWPVRPVMKLFMLPEAEGAKTSLWCATAPELASESGRYYDACRERRPSRTAQDDALARELWEKSEEWVRAFS
jgi:NAD(P)-dependent dehydrogenase (short-subunit alcohol dehydrogenase family)